MALRVALGEAEARKRRIREHNMRNEPITGSTIPASHVVPHDSKIIDRDVRELRAASGFADRTDTGGGCPQPLVDLNEAARIECNSSFVEANARRIRDPANRRQQMTAFYRPFSRRCPNSHRNSLSIAATDAERFGAQQDVNAFTAEDGAHRLGDIGVLASHDL